MSRGHRCQAVSRIGGWTPEANWPAHGFQKLLKFQKNGLHISAAPCCGQPSCGLQTKRLFLVGTGWYPAPNGKSWWHCKSLAVLSCGLSCVAPYGSVLARS